MSWIALPTLPPERQVVVIREENRTITAYLFHTPHGIPMWSTKTGRYPVSRALAWFALPPCPFGPPAEKSPHNG